MRHANMAGTSPHGGVLMAMGDDHTGESSTTLVPFVGLILEDGTDVFAARIDVSRGRLAEAVQRIVARMTDPAAPMMQVAQVRVLGGAMGRVAADATAFAHRDARYWFAPIAVWLEESDDDAQEQRANQIDDKCTQGKFTRVDEPRHEVGDGVTTHRAERSSNTNV